MGLEERLDDIQNSNKKKFRGQVVDRIRSFITYEITNPDCHSPYKTFTAIDDFILLHKLHPEWGAASSRKMQRNEVKGGNAFYKNYQKFIAKLTDDKKRHDKLMSKLFKTSYNVRNYDSLEQWKDERKRRFSDYSPSQLDTKGMSGGNGFMKKLRGWLKNKYPDDSNKRKAMVRYVFDQKYIDRSGHTTTMHWRDEYLSNPLFKGNSIRNLERGENKEGRIFVNNLRKWLHMQYPDDYQKRLDSRRKIFK